MEEGGRKKGKKEERKTDGMGRATSEQQKQETCLPLCWGGGRNKGSRLCLGSTGGRRIGPSEPTAPAGHSHFCSLQRLAPPGTQPQSLKGCPSRGHCPDRQSDTTLQLPSSTKLTDELTDQEPIASYTKEGLTGLQLSNSTAGRACI